MRSLKDFFKLNDLKLNFKTDPSVYTKQVLGAGHYTKNRGHKAKEIM